MLPGHLWGFGVTKAGLGRVILASSVGNALEWYDFTVFGYFAPQIAAAFFPAGSSRGLLLTLGTYGVSFLARPVGAAVLGGYADRRGRRASLTLSLALMTAGTLLMAVMPGFASIGWLAPAGILAARLIQGFSAGGEFGGATAFMIEHGGARPGFFGSFQFISQSAANILGAGVAWALASGLSAQSLGSWGFRVPFLLGLLIGPVGLYVRRHVGESPAFLAAAPARAPIATVLRQHPGRMALAGCAVAAGTASTYFNIYLPTFAARHLHMSGQAGFGVTFLVSAAPFLVTPLVAWLSDRIGQRRTMIPPLALLCVLAYPAFLLVRAAPVPFVLGGVILGITVLRAAYAAPLPALMAGLFPAQIRAVGMSIGYTAGVAVFGGFAQLIMESLIEWTGNATVPGLYLAGTALISLGALYVIGRLRSDETAGLAGRRP